jgi:hypothetical protein
MKKILIVLGVLAAAVLFVIVGGALVTRPGSPLDSSSRVYAIRMVESVLINWDLAAIRPELSPGLAKKDAELTRLINNFSSHLGPIRSHGTPKGKVLLEIKNFDSYISAKYIVPVTFDKAKGELELVLHLQGRGDNWKLGALNLNGAFSEKNP